MSRIKICIATSNAHKISEFREMFANAKLDCDVFGAGELSGFEPPEEDGKTFSENALIKARAAAKIAPQRLLCNGGRQRDCALTFSAENPA